MYENALEHEGDEQHDARKLVGRTTIDVHEESIKSFNEFWTMFIHQRKKVDHCVTFFISFDTIYTRILYTLISFDTIYTIILYTLTILLFIIYCLIVLILF